MNKTMTQAAAFAVLAACTVFAAGCEVLNSDGAPVAAGTADEPVATRERVMAEYQEAQRLGLITVGEEDPPLYTAEQNERIRLAGERVPEPRAVAKAK